MMIDLDNEVVEESEEYTFQAENSEYYCAYIRTYGDGSKDVEVYPKHGIVLNVPDEVQDEAERYLESLGVL